MSEEKTIPVCVALRARPLVSKEIAEGCQHSLSFVPNRPQIIVGQDKSFTFDYVFPCDSPQEEVYFTAVADRIDYLFKGYNVTVLAYGQTGSGKTYTMGTSYSSASCDEEAQRGIIQRAVQDIFKGVEERSSDAEFLIKVSFLEVYKEDAYDLLQKNVLPISIREDHDGIKIVGLSEQPVSSALETYQALERGSLSRTTASTAMNTQSSRSHAIFTITLEQRTLNDSTDLKRAKFHLVDLAGSERANKTGALGERFKEGVKINHGLLALGNVISALCDESSYVPYRDSKLTRLLQDSLGGNSHTLMIACVSPADSNLEETVNTLRYADRAKKIKNKPIVNRDPQNIELMKLRQQVQQLQIQLLQSQGLSWEKGNHEEKVRKEDSTRILLERNKLLENENLRLANELQCSISHTTALCEKAMLQEVNKEKLVKALEEIQAKTNQTIEVLLELSQDNPQLQVLLQTLKECQNKIVEIQCEQIQKDQEFTIYSPSKKLQVDLGDAVHDCDAENVISTEDGNFHLNSTLKQAAMSRELQDLDAALAQKEEEASKIQVAHSHINVMRIQFENNIKQMEEEINLLQKEKEELHNALKAAQASTNASKISENRRKRLQELESKISDMRKEIKEKGKLLKIKQDAERKVIKLQQEIQSMKSTRVKLLKQIKEESERYRSLKVEKDREVAQLKQKDRKRQCEIAKLQDQFQRQNNVLKRKVEEAAAAKKRLNEALQQQKQVAERRSRDKHPWKGVGTRAQQWLTQEIEVVLSRKEAQHHLQILVGDRQSISELINILKESLETSEPPEKKRLSDNTDEDSSLEERDKQTEKQLHILEKELEIRNGQISDLQHQICDADEDEKTNHRWESVQNMVEAKCAMKFLFNSVITAKFDAYLDRHKYSSYIETLESELTEAKYQLQTAAVSQEELQHQIRKLKSSHTEQMSKLTLENEEKTLYLLKQLNSSSNSLENVNSDSALLERIAFQENEIKRLSYLNDELLKKDNEITELRRQITLAACKGTKPRLMPDLPAPFKLNDTVVISTAEKSAMEDFLEDSLGDSYDEIENDPDWRATPQWKRAKSLSRLRKGKRDTNVEESKVSVSSSGCMCKVSCATKRCGCKKQFKNCSDLCKCAVDSCCNRDKDESSDSTQSPDENVPLNTTYGFKEITSGSQTVLREFNAVVDGNDSDDFISPETRLKWKCGFSDVMNEGGVNKQRVRKKPQKYFEPL